MFSELDFFIFQSIIDVKALKEKSLRSRGKKFAKEVKSRVRWASP